jgi:drug/metabolite transporter (DMT)-like permease
LKPRDLADLLLLAALWGGSFLFMRHAAPAFGAVPLMWLRVVIASACLLPLLLARRQGGELRARAGVMAVMGLSNSALPFVLIAWATLSITAGLAAILNATTPIFTAVVAALWLRERLTPPRLVGLLLGLAGVVVLAADQADFKPGGSGWALLASLCAALSYPCEPRCAQPVVRFSSTEKNSYIAMAIAPTTTRPAKARPICIAAAGADQQVADALVGWRSSR